MKMLSGLASKIVKDSLVLRVIAFQLIFCVFVSAYFSLPLGIFGLFCYILGFAIPLVLLSYRHKLTNFFNKFSEFTGYSASVNGRDIRCGVCDAKRCQRHKACDVPRKPWKGLLVDEKLDRAVESFYSRILDNFIRSWFSLLSHEEDFLLALRQGLREATCHIIRKVKHVDVAAVLTNKILPIAFDHMETIQKMLKDGITMEKLPLYFIQSERPIHPAVLNRETEMDYLRSVAKCLIPKIFHNESFHSKIFFSLVRELIACWVLLPLMDVAADPNLLNLMVVHATDTKSTTKKDKSSGWKKVEFLKNFAEKNVEIIVHKDDTFLKDKEQLYSFMQFLKKEEAVEVLTFYLDVDDLNKELRDPTVTTDPAKLSSLYHQSEKLIKNYHNLIETKDLPKEMDADTLSEAHEKIKDCLGGELRKAYFKTNDYFALLYGSKEVKLIDDNKGSEQSGAVSRLGTKLKDALRGAIDGTLVENHDVPTVWDALSEPQISGSNPTIYNSVTQKLRKERGQNLDPFLVTFMQSLEQTADVGEDVAQMSETKAKTRVVTPGKNLVFGNLFDLSKYSKISQISFHLSYYIKGPSQCFIYILHRVLNIPKVFVRLAYAFVCISQHTVDAIISKIINKYLKLELYESQLSIAINLLENHIFGSKQPEIQPHELLERQRKARERMQKVCKGLENVIDVLQSPSLNKHLMYCIFDVVLTELYPEFSRSDIA